jgi:hypothetical protein
MLLLCVMDMWPAANCERRWRVITGKTRWQMTQQCLCERSSHQPMKRSQSAPAIGSLQLDKVPKTKNEIEMLIMAELRDCQDCETAWGVMVVAVEGDDDANWTVSQFNRGESSAYACDQALQRIVPHYQRLYELVQKH